MPAGTFRASRRTAGFQLDHVVPLEPPGRLFDRVDLVDLDVELDVLAQLLQIQPMPLEVRDRLAADGGNQVGERPRDRLGRLELVHQLQRIVFGRVGLDPAAVFVALDKTEHGDGLVRRLGARPDRHRDRFGALAGFTASRRRRRPRLGEQLDDLGLVVHGRLQAVEHEVAGGEHARLVRERGNTPPRGSKAGSSVPRRSCHTAPRPDTTSIACGRD